MEFIIILLALLFLVGYYLFSTLQDMKIKKAEKAVESGDLETALSIFMDSLKKNPNDMEALWHLGNINEEKQHYPEAIGYYSKLIEIGKETKLFTLFELYRRTGLLYKNIGRDQEALDNLFQAYQYVQSSKDVLENIAMIIYSQKYFHRALTYFDKTAQFLKNQPDFLRNYALCNIMIDRINDALNLLEESIRFDQNSLETRFIIAFVYFKNDGLQKSREFFEDIINSEKSQLSNEQLYFSIKILFLIYFKNKNYDTARELFEQLKNLNNVLNIESNNKELQMAYIFFRIQQGYYDIALEEIEKNINLEGENDIDKLSDQDKQHLKESRSHIYELVSSLDRYKKEKDKYVFTGNKPPKFDTDYSITEQRAIDAQKELDTIIDDWKNIFVQKDPLWTFFGVKPHTKFDPTLIIEKYTEDNIKSLKYKGMDSKRSSLYEDSNELQPSGDNPCETLLSADFPTFLSTSLKLAENMGFKVINQNVKIDSMAYTEGQAADMLCQEKFKRDSRVLFCIRRWSEPVGYLSVMNIMTAFKSNQADRLILVSTSPLSVEASRAIENMPNINFYRCEEITSYL